MSDFSIKVNFLNFDRLFKNCHYFFRNYTFAKMDHVSTKMNPINLYEYMQHQDKLYKAG